MRGTLRRARGLAAGGLALAAITMVFAPARALAQDEATESLGGTFRVIEDKEQTPVEGVVVTVLRDGEVIGTGQSDATGAWRVQLPGPGSYRVELDVSSLPDGVALTDPDRTVLPAVEVQPNQDKVALFRLGPGITSSASTWERAADLFVIGLKLGAIIALSAIGLSLVFGVTGLVNFAHGDLVTLGAVLAYWLNASASGPQWHLLVAAVPAVVLAAAFGGAQELGLWRPLRRRQTGLVALIVISIGLSFVIRYLILVIAEVRLPKSYLNYAVQESISFLGVSTVPKNLVIIGLTVLVLVLVGIFLQRTKLGTAMRAVADNSDLAESSGIDVQRVILVTWVVGAGLAALGGILFGVSEGVQWDMGFRLLLLIFAAVILGGLGTAFGAMVGGFAIGVAVEMSTLWVPVELKTVIALAALVVMLLVRPQGLLGSRERIG